MRDTVYSNDVPFSWPKPRTYVYKKVGTIEIQADVSLLSVKHEEKPGPLPKRPIMLFIHGGGWIKGTRRELSRPLLYEFLRRGFIVVSIDYRLLPESDFLTGQLEDIRDAEGWLREKLPIVLLEREPGVLVDSDSIVVCGGSAGAHLAAFTPKLWKTRPTALLLLYGPTNLLELHPSNKTAGPTIPGMPAIPKELTPEIIKAACLPDPPTNTTAVFSVESLLSPRNLLGLMILRKALLPEFLLRRLIDGDKLPQRGSVPEDEVKSISPFYFAFEPGTSWPPTMQILGSGDELFDVSQVESFDHKLRSHGVPSSRIIVPKAPHAFDLLSHVGDPIHLNVIRPACDFVTRFVQAEPRL